MKIKISSEIELRNYLQDGANILSRARTKIGEEEFITIITAIGEREFFIISRERELKVNDTLEMSYPADKGIVELTTTVKRVYNTKPQMCECNIPETIYAFERRKVKRMTVRDYGIEVRIRWDKKDVDGILHDLSTSGISICFSPQHIPEKDVPPLGSKVDLSFDLQKSVRISGKGEVVHYSIGSRTNEVIIGVKFRYIDDVSTKAIATFAEAIAESKLSEENT